MLSLLLLSLLLNGESADVPEDIVVDWSLRFTRSATAPIHPESHVQCGRYCYALPYVVHVLRSTHVIKLSGTVMTC